MLTDVSSTTPFIAGSSVHKLIERLWHDVFRCVLSVYHIRYFTTSKKREKLTRYQKKDLYSLHLVYNQISIKFQDWWNSPASTTYHSMTPLQLFTSGILNIPDSITQPILTRWCKAFTFICWSADQAEELLTWTRVWYMKSLLPGIHSRMKQPWTAGALAMGSII